MSTLKVNGKTTQIADPQMPLLLALREVAGLTGTKYGCGKGVCGACTVHLDGLSIRSCVTPVGAVQGREVTTIEGLAQGGLLHRVQRAWLALDVVQCGYCQSGMVMAAAALLNGNPNPSDADIDAAVTNLCRCGTYHRVRQAILLAAQGDAAIAEATRRAL
jgi:isoquinoline 1-oxidoreductase subunit alpha